MTLLYKYRPIDKFALDIIANGRLYLAKWQEMNDPHEALMVVQHPQMNLRYHANPVRLVEICDETVQVSNCSARMCSLSRVWHSNLMWSHYGDAHKGVAIGFEIPDSGKNYEVIDVKYDDVVPEFSPPIHKSDIRRALSHKSKEWSYEQEVRLVSFDVSHKYIDGIVVKDITFGLRVPPEDIQLFARLVSGMDVGFFQVSDKPGFYSLSKTDISREYGVEIPSEPPKLRIVG